MTGDTIPPFLGPIAHPRRGGRGSQTMVKGAARVSVEREGELEPDPDVTLDEQNLQVAVRNCARLLGDDISEEQPLLDARLSDGSRVAAVLPPVSLDGTTL